MKISRYHACSPPVLDEKAGTVKVVVLATRTAEIRALDVRLWELLIASRFDSIPEDTLNELIDIELLVPAEQRELEVVLGRHRAASESGTHFYQVVQPTAWCQLGCGYCGQSHGKRFLSAEDQDAYVERFRARMALRRYRTCEIGWFGAEPVIGIEVIRALTPRLAAVCADRDVSYRAKVVTNGVGLNRALAHELIDEHHVRFIEITLDGPPAVHDARRHRKEGGGSFQVIFRNLCALAMEPHGCTVSVRCNVDRRNADDVSALIRMLADADLAGRVSFYAAPVHAWGNDADAASLTAEEFAAREIGWFVELLSLGFSPAVKPSLKPVVCLAVGASGEVVDADGNVFNCTEVPYVAAYGEPNSFSLGTLRGGVDESRRSAIGGFNDRIAAEHVPCASCRMLPVCGGSCPKLWGEGVVPCPPAKSNIESRLLLLYAEHRRAGAARPSERVHPAADPPVSEQGPDWFRLVNTDRPRSIAPTLRTRVAERSLVSLSIEGLAANVAPARVDADADQ